MTSKPQIAGWIDSRRRALKTVTPDRLDRAVVEGVFAQRLFLGRFRLLEDVGESCFIVADEVRWRGLAAQIAVDALRIDVVAAGCLARHLIVGICHEGDSS